MERDTLRVLVSTIQIEQCSKSIHQTDEAGGITFQEAGSVLHHLSGQFADNATNAVSPEDDNAGHSHSTPGVGIQDQLGEECAHPDTGDPVLGFSCGLNKDDNSIARGQAKGYCPVLQPGQQEDQGLYSRPSSSHRQDDSDYNGSPPSTIVLQEPAAPEEPGSAGNYDMEVHLDRAVKEELQWWKHELMRWNGRPLHPPFPDITIETDASLLGWGAAAEGVSTRGL